MEYTPIPIEFTTWDMVIIGTIILLPLALLALVLYAIVRSLRKGGLRGLGMDVFHLVGGILKVAAWAIALPFTAMALLLVAVGRGRVEFDSKEESDQVASTETESKYAGFNINHAIIGVYGEDIKKQFKASDY